MRAFCALNIAVHYEPCGTSLETRRGARKDPGEIQADQRRQITELETQRRKLLQLLYADKVSPAGFHAEKQRIAERIAVLSNGERQAVMAVNAARNQAHGENAQQSM